MKYLVPVLFVWLAGPAPAQDSVLIDVPSGQRIWWQDVAAGAPGPHGLSYRFRFVAPDLGLLVPMAPAAPMEALTDEDMEALEDLAAREGNTAATILSDALAAGLILPSELDQAPAISIHDPNHDPGAVPVAPADDGVALPPAPESLLRDPMHDDIVWLCENFVLPRLAATDAPRPTEIVISLSDRPQEGAALIPGAVQLFEAFSLPPDRDTCVWEPF